MERQYDYRPKWMIIIFCTLFFGACALVLAAEAKDNDRGLIINGIVELSADGATVFYWVLTALSVGFVAFAGFLAIIRLTLRQRIALTETCLMIPRSSWSGEEVAVPFGDIHELSTYEVSGQRLLKIVHKGGKFNLTASLLPRKEDFDEICEVLTQGVKACRSDARKPNAVADRPRE